MEANLEQQKPHLAFQDLECQAMKVTSLETQYQSIIDKLSSKIEDGIEDIQERLETLNSKKSTGAD